MSTYSTFDSARDGSPADLNTQGRDDSMASTGGAGRRTLSPVQIGLLVAVGLLAIAVEALTIRSYLQSSVTSDVFEQASLLTTNLANIQREALLLHAETERVLRDPARDLSHLELRRSLLNNQMRFQSGLVSNDPEFKAELTEFQNTLVQYDSLLARLRVVEPSERLALAPEFEEVLPSLDLQLKALYDKEEQSFFNAFSDALQTQRSSEILLLAVSGIVVVLGLLTVASLGRTVRALRTETDERRRAEEALREANESLERRVEERTLELSTANERLQREVFERAQAQRELRAFAAKLERSNRELQDFASIAAHDLQEPLRKVMAFGDRLMSKYSDALGEQGNDYLERMRDASGRMGNLINDLLTYSRVTTKAQPFGEVDLDQVAQEVVSDLEIRIEELGGRVELEGLPTIDADPVQMRQLMQNLISNGLKYHRSDVPPVVRIRGRLRNENGSSSEQDQHPDELCRITVEDNGIGFEDKHAERIFGIFQRLHSRQEYEGTGMGLAICRKIAERHGGNIKAKGVPGQGATITVTLPVKQPKGEDSQ